MDNNILKFDEFINEFLFFKKKERKNYFPKIDISNEDENSILNDLKHWIEKSKKTATEIIVVPAAKPSKNTQLISHFGGDPYFDQNEEWPLDSNGDKMIFLCQIISDKFQNGIKMIQIYQDYSNIDEYESFFYTKQYNSLNNKPKFLKNEPVNKLKDYHIKYANIKFKDFIDYSIYNNTIHFEKFENFIFKKYNQYDKYTLKHIINSSLDLCDESYNIKTAKINGYPFYLQVEEPYKRNDKFILQITDNIAINFDIGTSCVHIYLHNSKLYATWETT
jgi:uncharacterized protein YwqG